MASGLIGKFLLLPLQHLRQDLVLERRKLRLVAEKISVVDRQEIEQFADLVLFFIGNSQQIIIGRRRIQPIGGQPGLDRLGQVAQVIVLEVQPGPQVDKTPELGFEIAGISKVGVIGLEAPPLDAFHPNKAVLSETWVF